jgi:hypothetical protein
MFRVSSWRPQSITKPQAAAGNLLCVGALTPASFSLAPVNLRKSAQRLPQLDTLRGFLLVWMTLTHLPTHVSAYSNQMVGYVSAAEGFILLAAILVARIQQGAREKFGVPAAQGKLWRRVLRIYSYHLALLAFAFSVGAAAAAYFHRVPLQNLLDFFLQHPAHALIAAPVLLYNPPLLDILPMYIVFMLFTPIILRISERWGWRPVLIGSSAIWLLAQFGLRGWIYTVAAHLGFSIPLNEMGAFDWFGWQFLWIAGLCLGSAGWSSLFSKTHIPKWVVWLSATLAVVLFVCRHTGFDVLTGPTLFDALVDKWKLGIFRLIDAAAIGILLVKFGSPLAKNWLGKRLATMGRASLEVFSAHLVFCFVFLGLGSGPDAQFPWWQDAIILAVTICGLYLVAGFIERRRTRPSRLLADIDLPERVVHAGADGIR